MRSLWDDDDFDGGGRRMILAHCPYLGVGEREGHEDLLYSRAGIRGSSQKAKRMQAFHRDSQRRWIQTRLQSLTARLRQESSSPSSEGYSSDTRETHGHDDDDSDEISDGGGDGDEYADEEGSTKRQQNNLSMRSQTSKRRAPTATTTATTTTSVTELTLLYLKVLQRSEDYGRREIIRQYEAATGLSLTNTAKTKMTSAASTKGKAMHGISKPPPQV